MSETENCSLATSDMSGEHSEISEKPSFWLRAEKKPLEERAALTPTTAKKLIDAGFHIYVERDTQRVFDDDEYEAVGCELVENDTWHTAAPVSVPIIGLKELPESDEPIRHTHIQFAHCYKEQAGWSKVLHRFYKGGGTLYDLEFLKDERNRRVAAFGFYAGFTGAAAGVLAYAAQKQGGRLERLTPYANEEAMLVALKTALGDSLIDTKAMVMGANGRCGSGAVSLLEKVGLRPENIIQWDITETEKGGPFKEILDVDIFINCIYLSSKIPEFINRKFIQQEGGADRRLSVVVDVSCDTTNPFNPIPIYFINTTFTEPTVDVELDDGNPLMTVISIDHLPTLLPREASEQFSQDLFESLLKFTERSTTRVWTEAKNLFDEKLAVAVAVEEKTIPVA